VPTRTSCAIIGGAGGDYGGSYNPDENPFGGKVIYAQSGTVTYTPGANGQPGIVEVQTFQGPITYSIPNNMPFVLLNFIPSKTSSDIEVRALTNERIRNASTSASSSAVAATLPPTTNSATKVNDTCKRDDDRDSILVSHYTTVQKAQGILSQQVIIPGEGLSFTFNRPEAYVYVFEGRSTPRRATEAGARSVEARVVFNAKQNELELDPEQTDRIRRGASNIIREAKRFIRSGPVQLATRNAMLEIPSLWERWFR